jgi:replicative DNA helicase
LIHDEEFSRQVIPFLQKDYFSDRVEGVITEEILNFFSEFNKMASKEVLLIQVSKRRDIGAKELDDAEKLIKSLEHTEINFDWLMKESEAFCKQRALYNAILQSIQIIEGNDKNYTPEALPSLLSEALSITFDSSVGHNYIEDADARFEFYRRKEEKVPFDIEMLNKITDGGLSRKSLTVLLAATGVGKSLVMCHLAAANLLQNKNVLYISMEMSEERIAERIDANLLNLGMSELKTVEEKIFNSRIEKLKNKTNGRLIVKEYPTSSAHAGHFRALIEELKSKKNFVPDIIYIDYLNICASQRMKHGAGMNSYTYVKAIAEELRGLAVEYNLPLVSATQANRCLTLDTLVNVEHRGNIEICNLNIGDKIQSHSGYVDVTEIYPITEQDVYEITLKSGKTIQCSSKHIFPTSTGMKSIDSGLKIKDFLFSI